MNRRAFLVHSGVAVVVAPAVLRRRDAAASTVLDPAVCGAWAPRVSQPRIPIHVAALPGTGRMLCVYGRGWLNYPGGVAWLYDGVTSRVIGDSPWSSVPFDYDPMCGGGLHDDDGALRFYGGRSIGANRSARYTPETDRWAWGPWLSDKKSAYYSTAVRIGAVPGYPNGAILNAFGRRNWIDIYDPEQYAADFVMPKMPASANIVLPGTQAANYPRMMPLPDGTLFLCGTDRQLRRLDVPSATWTTVGFMLWGTRYEGCATPIGESGYEFLLSGGDLAAVNRRMERVDARTGISRPTATLAVPRWQHNTVLLPDGTVLLIGGRDDPAPLAPELYDPVTETVRTLARVLPLAPGTGDQGPAQRAYHSVADLLDDGRVVWGGGVQGTAGFAMETFSPPYLFQGSRPALTIPGSAQASYGGTVTCASADAATIDTVVLMAPGVVSHGCNFAQRRVPLTFVRTPGALVVTLPSSSTVAVPGWHRLFALRGGVPSMGQWVRLTLP